MYRENGRCICSQNLQYAPMEKMYWAICVIENILLRIAKRRPITRLVLRRKCRREANPAIFQKVFIRIESNEESLAALKLMGGASSVAM